MLSCNTAELLRKKAKVWVMKTSKHLDNAGLSDDVTEIYNIYLKHE